MNVVDAMLTGFEGELLFTWQRKLYEEVMYLDVVFPAVTQPTQYDYLTEGSPRQLGSRNGLGITWWAVCRYVIADPSIECGSLRGGLGRGDTVSLAWVAPGQRRDARPIALWEWLWYGMRFDGGERLKEYLADDFRHRVTARVVRGIESVAAYEDIEWDKGYKRRAATLLQRYPDPAPRFVQRWREHAASKAAAAKREARRRDAELNAPVKAGAYDRQRRP